MLKRVLLILYPLIALILVGCFLDEYKSEDGKNVEPEVTLKLNTETGFNVGNEIKFEAYGSDDNDGIKHYVWRVDGDEKSGSKTEFSYTFSDDGEHTIEVKAVANSNEETPWKLIKFNIAPKDAPLVQNLIPNEVLVDEEVSLVVGNIGEGDIKSCIWKIDGKDTTTSEPELKWTFSKDNINKTISIEVILKNNSKSSETKTIKFKLIQPSYPWHKDIAASTFWAGEGASSDNDNISNFPSAWHSKWTIDFGLEDHPTKIDRDSDHIPTSKDFTGNQNPYYIALPYNDFSNVVYDGKGDHITTDKMINGKKASSQTACYWKNPTRHQSACKNRWVEIKANGRTCYAQWEDAGPYYYEDTAYVFGDAEPLCTVEGKNAPNAGIDLSPSVWLYLGKKLDKWGYTGVVDWKFVNESEVPNGPWKKHVTTNQVDWN